MFFRTCSENVYQPPFPSGNYGICFHNIFKIFTKCAHDLAYPPISEGSAKYPVNNTSGGFSLKPAVLDAIIAGDEMNEFLFHKVRIFTGNGGYGTFQQAAVRKSTVI